MTKTERRYVQANRVLSIEDFVIAFEPVSIDRIATAFKIHVKTAWRDVRCLEKQGRVTLDEDTNIVTIPSLDHSGPDCLT